MKSKTTKNILALSLSALSFSFTAAQTNSVTDTSLQVVDLVSMQTILVNAINSPTGISTQQIISPSQLNTKFNLKNLNTGRDIPILLQELPGVVSSSDAGNGIGYTGIRVRGADATRTNITVNGVPINDAESHGTFWVNMPDLASSLGNAQLTRGVGSSTNGAGAFGATLALTTQDESLLPTLQINAGIGSFNTYRYSIKLGIGNYNIGKNIVGRSELRSSLIQSNGFIDRASSDLSSYFFSTSIIPKNHNKWEIKLIAFGGQEKTYQAWWGVPIEKFNLGGSNPTNQDSQLLVDHYNRNAGVSYRNAQDSLNLFQSNPSTYNYYTYPNEIDNYRQLHHHLNFIRKFNHSSSLTGTAYHTFGTGYFEQFRYNDAFSKYNISPIRTAADTNVTVLITQSDLVRQRWLRNNLVGLNLYFIHKKQNYSYVIGSGINQYIGDHFGRVTQILALPQSTLRNPHEYYNSIGKKFDANVFSKFNYLLTHSTNLTLDAQVRKVNHTGKGTDNDLRNIDFTGDFLFFNPKIFLEHSFLRKNSITAAWMRTNKEPSRSDFTDHPNADIPKPEQLNNTEITFRHNGKLLLEITAYNMQYKNQLVLTGAVNDVGTPLRKNVENSYRRGIEIDARYAINQKSHSALGSIVLLGNIALSRNTIINAPVSWLDYATYTTWDTVLSGAPIAFSPNTVASIGFNWISSSNNTTISWRTKYVSQQFLDNTGSTNRSLPAYTFSELTLSKTIVFEKNPTENKKGLFNNYSELKINLQFNNIFNKRYASNAYTYGYLYGSRDIIQEVFVFPQAPANVLLNLQYKMY
jgi:iron complex outermembrane receptor protein